MNRQELVNMILMISVFVLIFSAWSICVVLWIIQYTRRQRQLRQRLGVGGKQTQESQALLLWRRAHEAGRPTERRRKETLSERLERLRIDVGWKSSAHRVVLGVIFLAAMTFAVVFMLGFGLWAAAGGGGLVLLVFFVATKRRLTARTALSERQFIDSLGIAARALRAGHPLIGAFQLVTEEIGDPMGALFGEICQEQALGLDIEASMRRIAEASHNADLKLFATAVGIQLSSGGNLAELMDSLASVMRSRVRLHRRVRVLTAQTNMSKWILISLPVLLFVALNVIAPRYMELFYTTTPGQFLLAGTVISVVLGAWLMERLSVIRY